MFGMGGFEIVILMVAALVILGPERLPAAASWLARSIKQVREYAAGTRDQLTDEFGPEFADLRKPLADLQKLRGLTPRAAITKHLLDGDDSFLSRLGGSPDRTEPAAKEPTNQDVTQPKQSVNMTKPAAPTASGVSERSSFDTDAT